MEKKTLSGLACFSTKLEVGRYIQSPAFKYLILESDPRPRYYTGSTIPDDEFHIGDHHFYLIIKNPMSCFQDVVLRNAIAIREQHHLDIHIFPGQMSYKNQIHPCIRINTPDPGQLKPVIEELIRKGIKFITDHNIDPYQSNIQYKRFIEITKLEKGIYQDQDNSYRYFIKMPGDIDYTLFQEIITRIKNNCNFHLFDAFLTYLFYKDTIIDFAGLYSAHCDHNRFAEFKLNLEKEYKRVVHN